MGPCRVPRKAGSAQQTTLGQAGPGRSLGSCEAALVAWEGCQTKSIQVPKLLASTVDCQSPNQEVRNCQSAEPGGDAGACGTLGGALGPRGRVQSPEPRRHRCLWDTGRGPGTSGESAEPEHSVGFGSRTVHGSPLMGTNGH